MCVTIESKKALKFWRHSFILILLVVACCFCLTFFSFTFLLFSSSVFHWLKSTVYRNALNAPHVHTGPTCYCDRVIPSSSYTQLSVYGMGLVFILNDRCMLFILRFSLALPPFRRCFFHIIFNVLFTYGSYLLPSRISSIRFFFFLRVPVCVCILYVFQQRATQRMFIGLSSLYICLWIHRMYIPMYMQLLAVYSPPRSSRLFLYIRISS